MRDFLIILGITALCGWVTALPLLFAGKAPGRLKLQLAMLPAAMLLCPLPLICRKTVVLPAVSGAPVTMPGRLPDELPALPQIMPAGAAQAEQGFAIGAELIFALWLIGTVICLLGQLAGYISVRRHFAEQEEISEEIRAVFDGICGEMNIRRRPRIAFSPAADAPLLTGVFRPVILLPEADYTEEELRLILRHELTHFRQGHLLLQGLARLAAAVHWFHPLGHLLLRALPDICEQACDEIVASALTREERKRYGLVILRFAGKEIGGCAAFAALRGKDPRAHMEGRLKALMEPRKMTNKLRLLAAVSAAVLVLCGCGISYELAPEKTKTEAPAAEMTSEPDKGAEPGSEAGVSEDSSEPMTGDLSEESASEPVEEPSASDEEISPEDPAVYNQEEAAVSEAEETVPQYSDFPEPQTHYPAHCWPVPGHTTITSNYGGTHDHHGIDISGEEVSGSPIAAWRNGTVVEAGYDTQHGNCVLIDHGDGLCSFYAHCESLAVKAGDQVNMGQTIAAVGATGNATGPHLHFELRQDGEAIDPSPWFADILGQSEVCSYPKEVDIRTESHHEESAGHHKDGHH